MKKTRSALVITSLVTFTTLLAPSAFAKKEKHKAPDVETPQVCTLPPGPGEKIYTLDDTVGYWTQPMGQYLFATNYGGTGAKAYDLDAPGKPKRLMLPSSTDPMPIPDVMATRPEQMLFVHPGLLFYRVSDIVAGQRALPISTDRQNNGMYESAGIISMTATKGIARVLTWQNGQFRDYEITYDQNHVPTEVKPIGQVRMACMGHGSSAMMGTAMISKDGKMVGTFDVRSQTTHVYTLSDDGTCTSKADLGFKTSKVNFSYDGKWVAFSAFSPVDRIEKAYVYNLETNKTYPLMPPGDPTTQGTFPGFRADGKVLFEVVSRRDNTRTLHVVDPAAITGENLAGGADPSHHNCENCENKDSRGFAPVHALSGLWSSICHQAAPGTAEKAQELVLKLDPQQCKTMVHKFWNDYKKKSLEKSDSARKLKEQTLQAACPAAKQ